jgi:hypothetical protein
MVAFRKMLSGQLMYLSVICPCVKKVFKIVVVWTNSSLIFVNSAFRAASCRHEVQSYGSHMGHVISYRVLC